jgi:hypothetical protein
MNVATWDHCTFDCQILNVPKFTILTPLSLLVSCKLSFQIICLKMSSLPTSTLKSPKYDTKGIYQKHVQIPHRSSLSHSQFYSLLGYEHSEQ